MTGKFSELPRPERAKLVRKLVARGFSDMRAAHELGTTKNTVVGIRRDFGIAANFRPGFEGVKKSSSGVPLKMAASEAAQCTAVDEDERRCGYEHLPGSPYCGLPQHQALGKKPARRA